MTGEPQNYWTSNRRRLSRRHLLATGGTALASSALLACSTKKSSSGAAPSGSSGAGQASAGTPQPGGTYVNVTGFNNLLDAQKSSNAAQSIISLVQSRLFQFKTGLDPKVATDHDVINDLGTSIESPDAVTWTVKLRPDAKFSNIAPVNGRLFDAQDVKATFTRAIDPAISSPNRGSLSMIDPTQITMPDNQTVVFKLLFPYAPFPALLASGTTSWIYPREVLAGSYDPSKTVIGTGPFTLDSVQPDVAYIYKKNPDYFVKGLPYLDGIKTAIIPATQTQEAQFTAGNLDALTVPIIDVATMQQENPRAQLLVTPSATPMPLYPQEGDPTGPFYDLRVRQAVSLLIDRDALNKTLYNGQAVDPVFVPLYMGKWALLISDLPKDTQQWYQYNPTMAKQLLAAAGQSNLTIRLGYVTNGPFSTASYNNLAETLNAMMNQGGIKCNLFTQDYNTEYINGGKGSRDGHFDKDEMILAGIGTITDADSALFDNFSSKSTSNGDLLSDPTLDAMIDKQRATVNADDRLKAALDIERYLAAKVYTMPTPNTNGRLLINPRVQNYQYATGLGGPTETLTKVWLSKS